MSDLEDQQTDLQMLVVAAKNFLAAAATGWAGAEGTILILRDTMAESYAQFEWFDGFLSVTESMAGFTIGGAALAIILHVRHKRQNRLEPKGLKYE